MIEQYDAWSLVDREGKVLNPISTNRCRRVACNHSDVVVSVGPHYQERTTRNRRHSNRFNMIKTDRSAACDNSALVIFRTSEEANCRVYNQLVAGQHTNGVTTINENWNCTWRDRDRVCALLSEHGQGFCT